MEKNPPIYELVKSTGAIRRTRVNSVAVINDYYRTASGTELHPDYVEHVVLSKLEGGVGAVIDRLTHGDALSEEDILRLAIFSYLQYMRTPRIQTWAQEGTSFAIRERFLAQLQERPRMRQMLHRKGRPHSQAEVSERISEVTEALVSGELTLSVSEHVGIPLMLMGISTIPLKLVREKAWYFQYTACEYPFVICDHPISTYDPSPSVAGGVGMFSSKVVEVSMPLDPLVSLLMVPGSPCIRGNPVSPDTVRQMNLKTYAAAEWGLYGHSQEALEVVLQQARDAPETVDQYRPRPPALVTTYRYESDLAPFAETVFRPKSTPQRRRRKSPIPDQAVLESDGR